MIRPEITLAQLNQMNTGNMGEHLGIEFTGIGPDFIEGKLPVDHRTRQPMGLLHGGASVVLAETLGSLGASCCIDPATHYCVGLDINANHIRGVKEGFVYGRLLRCCTLVKPPRCGKSASQMSKINSSVSAA